MPRLLIIDDDADFLGVSSQLLTRKGFEVKNTHNWDDACSLIESFNPHVIILDVFLSGVDGLEICTKLKANPATASIPVVVISGYPKCADRAVHENGANAFISKPFEICDLINTIHNVLSHNNTMA